MASKKFVTFSNFLGLPVAGLEKEINSLLKKMESRKVHRVKVARGKKKLLLTTWLEKEIQKLECLVNYNCSPLLAKGKGKGAMVPSCFLLTWLSSIPVRLWVLGSRRFVARFFVSC